MAKAYRLTLQQWQNLPDNVKYKFPSCGAYPYHTNYHLCVLLAAIRSGEEIKEKVIDSYCAWTQKNVISRAFYDAKISKLHRTLDQFQKAETEIIK